MRHHDHAYKKIFSHSIMVAELLRGVVRQQWIDQADLSTLERVNGEYVTRNHTRRSSDMVWRVRGPDDWVYIYLLLEFQSRSDHYMALRMLAYLALLYEDLKRQNALLPGGSLPPVLPIVLYNGLPRWNAALNVAELIRASPELAAYAPCLRYLLLDEGALFASASLPPTNLATLLFRLEHERTEEGMADAIQALIDRLAGPEFDELQRTFTAWLRDALLPARAPGVSIPPVSSLNEVKTMITEETIDWSLRWKQKGRQEGEALLLERLLTRRFGPLPDPVRTRLAAASLEELEAWTLNVLDAQSLQEVFGGLKPYPTASA